jgi:hypothetical protein
MAYRRRGFRKSFRKGGSRKKRAGKVAHRTAKKVFRKAVRMPKRKLAKLYAAKCGKSRFKRVARRGGRRKRKY